MAKQRPEILALHLGWDIADVRDCRYQPTRYRDPIYTVGDDYYTVAKVGAKPCTFDLPWEKVDSWVTAPYGWEVYVAKVRPVKSPDSAKLVAAAPTIPVVPVAVAPSVTAGSLGELFEREEVLRQMLADSEVDERFLPIFERLYAKGWRK